MANEITRKQFLMDVLAGEDLSPAHIECATAWLAALEKKSTYKPINKTAIQNAELADLAHSIVKEHGGEPVSAKWIAEHVSGITSPQKAVGVLRKGIEAGLFDRVEVKGRAYFRAL